MSENTAQKALAALDRVTSDDVRALSDGDLWRFVEMAHNWKQLGEVEQERRADNQAPGPR